MLDQINLVGTVGSGGTLSGEFTALYNTADLVSMRDLIGIQTPAAFTGTNMGFVVSYDGTTFYPLTNVAGTVVDIKAAGSRCIPLDATTFQGFQSVKAFTGSAQGQATVLTLIARRPV